ncbi:MAG: hypothetical protein RL530_595 [Actinomycetota bacterium]|mgnify:CR=1 FL=1
MVGNEAARQQSRLRVGIVGAGPVGVTFAQALAGAGHFLAGITAASVESRERVESTLPGLDILPVDVLLKQSDLVVLAIPADQIGVSVEGWAKLNLFRPGQIVIHTAAEFGTSVLSAAAAAGAVPIAIHPAMSFSGTSLDQVRVRDSRFAVTAPPIAVPIALALVIEMGAEPTVIAEEDRPKYAEAISVATTFSGLVVNQAIGLLADIGLPEAREVLSTLLHSSVDRALAEGYQAIEPEDFRG